MHINPFYDEILSESRDFLSADFRSHSAEEWLDMEDRIVKHIIYMESEIDYQVKDINHKIDCEELSPEEGADMQHTLIENYLKPVKEYCTQIEYKMFDLRDFYLSVIENAESIYNEVICFANTPKPEAAAQDEWINNYNCIAARFNEYLNDFEQAKIYCQLTGTDAFLSDDLFFIEYCLEAASTALQEAYNSFTI